MKIQVIPPEPPIGLAITQSIKETYFSSFEAILKIQLNRLVFGKITGSLLEQPGKCNLGLNLKSQTWFKSFRLHTCQNANQTSLEG